MCGDCSVEENRRALLGDAVMELVYTDPPYDMDYSGGRGCFEKSLRNVKKALAPMVRFDPYTLRWLADFPAPSYYIWTSKNGVPKYIDIFNGCTGFNILTWIKTNPVPFTHGSFLPDTEYCMYFKRRNAVWNNSLKPMAVYQRAYVSKKETRIENGTKAHPAIKPLDLVADKIRISTTPGGAVFDPFGGSGTTMIACEQLGRVCYMMEREPHYCGVIIDRWEAFTGGRADRVN